MPAAKLRGAGLPAGLWEYPDRSAVPSDPTDDTDLFGEGSASDDDLQPLANAASADDYGSGALSSAEDSSTAEHISTSEDVSTGSSETADEACSSACSSAATRVTSDVSPCPSETAALGGGDNSLGESMQKLALEGTDASEDTGREAGPGGPRGDPAPGTGGRDVDSTQPGPDSRQGVGAGSVCGDRVLRGTSGAVGSGDLRSEPDVAACRAHDRKAGSCGLHQPLGRGQGTEHVGRACACQSGPPEESGSAAESSGRSDESGGGSKIGSSQQQGSEPSPSFPEGSGDVGDGSDVGRVMDDGSVLDDVGAMAAGGESAAGPPQGVLKSSASGAEAKVAEGKAWRTDRIHRFVAARLPRAFSSRALDWIEVISSLLFVGGDLLACFSPGLAGGAKVTRFPASVTCWDQRSQLAGSLCLPLTSGEGCH